MLIMKTLTAICLKHNKQTYYDLTIEITRSVYMEGVPPLHIHQCIILLHWSRVCVLDTRKRFHFFKVTLKQIIHYQLHSRQTQVAED